MARLAPALTCVLLTGCLNDPRTPLTAQDAVAFCNSFEVFAAAKAGECGYTAIADIAVLDAYLKRCRAHAPGGLIDTRRAARCLDDVERTRCHDLLRPTLPDECPSVLAGRVAAGQPCTGARDCAAGAYCRINAACAGTCTAESVAMAECAAGPWGSRSCAPGSSCLSSRCRVAGQLGEACVPGSCGRDLVCNLARECSLPVGLGATCEIGACVDGLVCIDAQCVDGKALGEACSGDECLSTICTAGACRRPPRAGEVCSVSAPCQEGECARGLCAVDTSTAGACT